MSAKFCKYMGLAPVKFSDLMVGNRYNSSTKIAPMLSHGTCELESFPLLRSSCSVCMIVDCAVIRLKCRNMTLINLVENWIKICKKFVERNQTLFFMPRICAASYSSAGQKKRYEYLFMKQKCQF